ncbi:hypothetical protein LX64_03987 [Chitinophaga skermanii]|uniref:Uncharacterized protein n=1 Tax=Chitinophaga skermanii TaxID=331697 RepID=A0A327Q8M0_9BACT|nr:hypothetical protein [Chitinophaga skermanii]RAJ00285.1 hypothetical protein LX64_03987 [Chitinophaga skermanii]
MVTKETIDIPQGYSQQPHAMGWRGEQLVCFENGQQYYPTYDNYPTWRGMGKNMAYEFGQLFTRAITSPCGYYALIYTNFGTKGLLLQLPNRIIREVNRSYYYADTYEYPAAFFEYEGRTYLAHCPVNYNCLEFEDVITGEIVSHHIDRDPTDYFISRLEVSSNGHYLLTNGWHWHPVDVARYYDIKACMENPLLLDDAKFIETNTDMDENDDSTTARESDIEFTSAGFIDNNTVLTSAPGKELLWWDMISTTITRRIQTDAPIGNIIPINAQYTWDVYEYPKLIDLSTGAVIWQDETIDSGKQDSSIASNANPNIVWNKDFFKLAIGGDKKVHVLTLAL